MFMPVVEFVVKLGEHRDTPSSVILVEVDRKDVKQKDAELADNTGVPIRAAVSFEAALESVRPALEKAATILKNLVTAPSEFELEFGIKLTADAGAIFTKVGGEANFNIKATWKNSK
jgi:Trypsin-co-occurring domain 1